MITDLEISTDRTRIDLDVVCSVLRTSYWATGRKRSVIERAIRNSLCFGAYVDGRQVGFARVATDRAVFAYLMDVFVIPEFRGQGISKALMRAVLDHADLQNLRVFLLATKTLTVSTRSSGFGRWQTRIAGWPSRIRIATRAPSRAS